MTHQWKPREGKDRPTRERLRRGTWALGETEAAGVRVAIDFASHPIDRMEVDEIITRDQASAGRQFESLLRAATQTPGIRDSCTLWEPKGYESDDGAVSAVQERREVYLALGTNGDKLLRQIVLEPRMPRQHEIEQMRWALDVLVKFWKG